MPIGHTVAPRLFIIHSIKPRKIGRVSLIVAWSGWVNAPAAVVTYLGRRCASPQPPEKAVSHIFGGAISGGVVGLT
jgi:hypothetical protein